MVKTDKGYPNYDRNPTEVVEFLNKRLTEIKFYNQKSEEFRITFIKDEIEFLSEQHHFEELKTALKKINLL